MEKKNTMRRRKGKEEHAPVLACRLPGGMFVMKCAAECVFQVHGGFIP